MGVFDKIFKSQRDLSKENIKEIPWNALTSNSQLDEIEKESKKKTVSIFKHSTRCGISRMVLRSFEEDMKGLNTNAHKMYFLDLLANRDVSKEVAERFSVIHESPQWIVLKDKKVVHQASHHSINAEDISDFL